MSTPEQNFEIAAGESDGEKSRAEAIEGLSVANECDMLADLVRDDSLDGEYRRKAVEALGSPQCGPTLQSLLDDDELDGELRTEAERLVEESEDIGPQ